MIQIGRTHLSDLLSAGIVGPSCGISTQAGEIVVGKKQNPIHSDSLGVAANEGNYGRTDEKDDVNVTRGEPLVRLHMTPRKFRETNNIEIFMRTDNHRERKSSRN